MELLRKILFPFAWLYGGIVFFRNKLFDANLLSSKAYSFPVICIGNLRVGGTGKSPMVEYLLRLLQEKKRIATLSRGYKRSTQGFLLLNGAETAKEVGDEPLQFKTKFPNALVAVDESRQHGIAELQKLVPAPEVVLLDDAFQHRKVRAGLTILLTSYGDLYMDDFLLPMGNLRESKNGAKRTDIIIVTKCPGNLTVEARERIRKKLKPKTHQSLYFSTVEYHEHVFNGISIKKLEELNGFTLVTGIANPKPLLEFLKSKKLDFQHKAFADHHHFTATELNEFQQHKIILTTEKDFMRLKNELPPEKLYYLSIRVKILWDAEKFDREIGDFVGI